MRKYEETSHNCHGISRAIGINNRVCCGGFQRCAGRPPSQREDIDYAVAQEWFFGYEDGTFKPDKIITQKQITAVVNRAFPEGATRADLATVMRAGQQALNEAQLHRAQISVVDGASIAEICEAMQAGYESDKAQGRIGRAGEFVTGLSVYSHIENACKRDRYIGDHGIDAQRFIREIACTNESGDVNTYEQEFTVSTSNRHIYKQALPLSTATGEPSQIFVISWSIARVIDV